MKKTYEITIENLSDYSRVFITDEEQKLVTVGSGATIVDAFKEAYDLITSPAPEPFDPNCKTCDQGDVKVHLNGQDRIIDCPDCWSEQK
jgi:hypothetical protein